MPMVVASINRVSGRAVVREPNGGRTWVLDIEISKRLKPGKGVHVESFLSARRPERKYFEKHAYRELIQYVRLAYWQEYCLLLLLTSVDQHCDAKTRREAARQTVRLMRNAAIRCWLAKRLARIPLGKRSADIAGVPDGKLRRFLRGVRGGR